MVNLGDEQHYENRQILHQLHSEAPNDAVKKVIKLYNYDNEGTVIYKDMLKSAKKDFQSTAEFLLQIQIEEQVKSKLVSAIINRIDSLLLELCQKCEKFYKVDREDVPTITCQNCGQGIHEPCYRDISRTIASYPGIVYICANCINPSSKSSTQSQPSEEKDQLSQNSQENSQTHLPAASQSPNRGANHSQLPFSPDDDKEHDMPLCQLYRRGACPHGITGLRKINGRVCNSAHPKRCQRWCQYGDDQEMGCSEGRDCERFHPILCKFSLKYKLCTNRSCKFNHVKGTRRYRPRTEEDQQVKENSNNYNQEQGRYPSNPHASTRTENRSFHNPAWDPKQSHQSQKPVKVWDSQHALENPETIQLSFLEEIKTQMREMQKEIKEMKENYRSPPIPFLPNPLLNLHQNPQHPHLAQSQQNLQPSFPQVVQQMSSLPTLPKGTPQNPQSPEVSQKQPTQQLIHQNQVFQSQI